ncbi:unnamed protein product, partial [Prorocentrum cordatum]
ASPATGSPVVSPYVGGLHPSVVGADREIQAWLDDAGLRAYNPPLPTHVSGTTIDLFLGPAEANLPVSVFDEFVGLSDHKLVQVDVPFSPALSRSAGFGRVSWTSGDEWASALESISDLLGALADAVEQAARSTRLRPPWFGGSATRLQRRAVLNNAAWARDATYVLVGRAAGAAKVSRVGTREGRAHPRAPLSPASFPTHEAYKSAVETAAWQERRKAAHRYLSLRDTNAGAAERFLTGVFKSSARFDMQLVDESSGAALSTDEVLDAIRRDLCSRAENDFPQDPAERTRMSSHVAAIRRAGASSGQAGPEQPYSEEEVEAALALLKPGKRTARMCNAAARAKVEEGFRFTRALLNLARALCVTSRLWSLRQFSPIRKSGPAVVRRLSALRPVSFASDMASVQDAAWLARNSHCIEAYCGPAQQGGVGDAVSLVIALVMNAQLRAAQDLLTWWAIADEKWAFDVASIGCGTAQGRRFSVHAFNAQLRALPVEIEQVAAMGNDCFGKLLHAAQRAEAALNRVIMARARLQVLPCDHPAAVVLRAAKDMGTPTWETAALRLLGRLPSPPADLLCHAMFPPERIEAARRDRAARKEVLREYRLGCVRPALLQYDRAAFVAASERPSLTFAGSNAEPQRPGARDRCRSAK